ncbi:MAG: thiamine-phosphate kinase [Spongiibacteraceae bacterium]
MALGEFALIKKFFTDIGPVAGVALGVGDDCALLDIPAGHQLATSVDTLVAGVHFPADGAMHAGGPALIAQKALRSNLSDLAAAGAQPLAFTLALTLPQADEHWLAEFARGLRECADEFAIPLIGGDTTRGAQRVITLQVFGAVPYARALLRGGAKPGDVIYSSGTLGDARAALDVLTLPAQHLNVDQQFWLQRYYRPSPRLALGIALRGIASAAIDISDGLAADLGHIVDGSGVGAIVDAGQLPLSPALRTHANALNFALHGGDDYELCFTAPRGRQTTITEISARLQLPLTAIGEIVAEKSLLLRAGDGLLTPLVRAGYQHF